MANLVTTNGTCKTATDGPADPTLAFGLWLAILVILRSILPFSGGDGEDCSRVAYC